MDSTSNHLSWHNPVALSLGAGCLAELRLGRAAVVLADAGAAQHPAVNAWRADNGRQIERWVELPSGLASVARARELAPSVWDALQGSAHPLIVAIGGGTTLDLAKVLRYWGGGGDLDAWVATWRRQSPAFGHRRADLWAVPTTAGTGSEVTRWATLWDLESGRGTKLSWAPTDGFPEQAWVDPTLTRSCPRLVVRDTALDTLSHALESIWNRHANELTATLAVDAARQVLHSLPRLLQQPDRDSDRFALSQASLQAGLAMSQTQTALAHALSYDLTLDEGLSHGLACAVWLPMVWSLATGAGQASDRRLAQIFGCPAEQGAARLAAWLEALGIPVRDLRDSASGRARLSAELLSPRGKNFSGNFS